MSELTETEINRGNALTALLSRFPFHGPWGKELTEASHDIANEHGLVWKIWLAGGRAIGKPKAEPVRVMTGEQNSAPNRVMINGAKPPTVPATSAFLAPPTALAERGIAVSYETVRRASLGAV